ncbi:hypothetical protein [Actinoplanes sp. NPDC051411]|uniref:hypothetical protein n=1 Tax=Actinoplanes sp. NPDC051411 TaxID=3155522 RepID=UPI00342F0EE0
MDVRRLAAIDMWGTRGTRRRRRVILAEFTLGVIVAIGFGAWLLTATSGAGDRLFGAWLIGSGLNYAPLAGYAIRLSRPGALDGELAGVDTDRELRRYSVLQLWIVVPLALLVLAVRDEVKRRRLPTA